MKKIHIQRGNNLEEIAYLTMKEKILSKEWLPQAHVTELKTAKLLGISRTPVRRAFLRLEAEGLLMIEANKGAKILEPKIDFKGYMERLEILELLFVQHIHYLELREIKIDFIQLDQLLTELIQLVEAGENRLYQEKERDLLKTFLSFHPNQFKTTLVSETLRNLHMQKNQALADLMKRNTAKKLQHYSKFLDFIQSGEYGLARKEVRILVNQLMLSAVNQD